ncbi:MAG: patatin [Verrucomicrobia bacterium]|nr:MAG: patatin [Verrucomicrobiota bacterium]
MPDEKVFPAFDFASGIADKWGQNLAKQHEADPRLQGLIGWANADGGRMKPGLHEASATVAAVAVHGPPPRKRLRVGCLFGWVLLLGGCAHYPVNAPLTRAAPEAGYRFNNLSRANNADSLFVVLAFSGGGTRAAALSYGVLEELAKTEIVWEGNRRRLLDEVDLISSVSGGSFTAAYYALYGDRIFGDFETGFLKRNIQGRLLALYCSPVNWVRLASRKFSRIDMVAEYYDRHLFGGHTFGDLVAQGRRPFLMINATDMSLGSRFEFTQDQFDLLCSDLYSFPLGRAVAASSAFPILLSPVTLRNYAGSCDSPEPGWIQSALADTSASTRRRNQALEARAYLDSTNRPFIHLLDGGLADNLGLRGPLEAIVVSDNTWRAMSWFQMDQIRKVVLIVVNASVAPDEGADRREKSPGLREVVEAAGRVPISRYSFETVELFRESIEKWQREINHRRQSTNAPAPAASGSTANAAPPDELQFYPIEVNFDALSDEAERKFFKSLPTSFTLPSGTVDRLRAVAARLLGQSENYRKLLRDLNGPEAR